MKERVASGKKKRGRNMYEKERKRKKG